MAAPRHIVDILKNSVNDFHRPNMFEVELFPPTPLILENLVLTQNMVQAIEFPSTTIPDLEIRRMGRKVTLPVGVQFGTSSITMRDDEKGKIRTFFTKWQQYHYGGIGDGKFNSNIRSFLLGSVVIYQLNSKHERTNKTILRNAYPATIGNIDLSHETDDAIVTFTVTVQFSYLQSSNNAPNFSDLERSPSNFGLSDAGE